MHDKFQRIKVDNLAFRERDFLFRELFFQEMRVCVLRNTPFFQIRHKNLLQGQFLGRRGKTAQLLAFPSLVVVTIMKNIVHTFHFLNTKTVVLLHAHYIIYKLQKTFCPFMHAAYTNFWILSSTGLNFISPSLTEKYIEFSLCFKNMNFSRLLIGVIKLCYHEVQQFIW